MLNKFLKNIPTNDFFGFKSSIEPQRWKEMSPKARNEHKARQAAYIKYKRTSKAGLISGIYPRHYSTVYRKTRRFGGLASSLERNVVKRTRKKIKLLLQYGRRALSAHEISAWKHTVSARGVAVGSKPTKLFYQLFGAVSHPRVPLGKTPYAAGTRFIGSSAQTNKLIYWDLCLPIYYLSPLSHNTHIISTADFVYALNAYGSTQISKAQYGSLLILNTETALTNNGGLEEYEIIKFGGSAIYAAPRLNENAVLWLYSSLVKQPYANQPTAYISEPKFVRARKRLGAQNRGYIKHIVRMRYRWFFQPKLSQFKLFKKFFKRSLKRYRKINKNKLFVSKFRRHFPKLTGLTEKGLLKLWLPFRRSYNQYWSTSNAVFRFSQSLLLSPTSLLVFLQLSPSFAASKYIIKSGAVSINGRAVTAFTQFRPGDIMQLNFVIWKSVRHFFDYQRWNNDFRALQYISFLQIDWSSLMFMMTRWPRKYELVAPSFLSERWIRYYIRQFPSKIRNFKKADGNWKMYKRIVTKR